MVERVVTGRTSSNDFASARSDAPTSTCSPRGAGTEKLLGIPVPDGRCALRDLRREERLGMNRPRLGATEAAVGGAQAGFRVEG